jgi:hypothetical protein
LFLLAAANRGLKWREIAVMAPGLLPAEHFNMGKWHRSWLDIWGMGVQAAVRRYCLQVGKLFPYRSDWK